MVSKVTLAIACATLFNSVEVRAGKNDWLSPVYKYIFQFPLPIPPVAQVKTTFTNTTSGIPIDYYEVHIKAFQYHPYPDLGLTDVVGYDGISPGPTFKIKKGREALVRFINEYDRPSSIHLHGSPSRAPFDGWAEDTTPPGFYKDYYYPNFQSARTLWYHDHAIHITAVNAYFGQAGFYLLSDDEEDARLGLPTGNYDIPLMLQAKQYQKNGQLFSPADERDSLFGDVIHVNGQPWPYLKVEPRKYRFRLLDASISRTFLLTLVEAGKSAPIPFTVIAADAGYLSRSVMSTSLFISMAERYEIVVDFAAYKGKNVTMMNGRDVMTNEDYASTDKVMQFVVGNTVTDPSRNGAVPASLASLPLPPPKSTPDYKFTFERTHGEWRINGVGFADVNNRVLAKPPRGTVQLWELENKSGGWAHPIHIHLIDFQVVSRTGGRNSVMPYETVALKDVVLLGPNEKLRVLARYQPWDGVYMFHCHNLVHEDHDMMGAFNVSVLKDFGYPETTKFIDPMESRWRSKPFTAPTDLNNMKNVILPGFSSLVAYADHENVEEALEEYHETHDGNGVVVANDVPSPTQPADNHGGVGGGADDPAGDDHGTDATQTSSSSPSSSSGSSGKGSSGSSGSGSSGSSGSGGSGSGGSGSGKGK